MDLQAKKNRSIMYVCKTWVIPTSQSSASGIIAVSTANITSVLYISPILQDELDKLASKAIIENLNNKTEIFSTDVMSLRTIRNLVNCTAFLVLSLF